MGSRFILFSLLLASLWILSGCSAPDSSSSQPDTASSLESSQTSGEAVEVSHMFTDRDMEIGYDEESCARITLSGDSASCDADGVTISGSTVTITQEGTYLLTGTLDSGTVEVRAGDQDKVQLVLDNASVTNPTGAAVYVEEADKVVIDHRLPIGKHLGKRRGIPVPGRQQH